MPHIREITEENHATSVYVHFPWCLRKCPYCDFISYRIERGAIPHQRYAHAVLTELELRRPELQGRTLESIFFGGGTPSLWNAASFRQVLSGIIRAFDQHAPDLEVTVECNPSSLDAEKAGALMSAGANRLSVGVQALRTHHLNFLGRSHTPEKALESVRAALSVTQNVNADLIFGLPEQNLREWHADLERVAQTGVPHISAYALTIEANTQFGELHRKNRLPMAPEESYADLYRETERTLTELGFAHYEVSNYARKGFTARHNQHYWRGGDYLGLGVGAVGALTLAGCARRYRNHKDIERYLNLSRLSDIEHAVELLDAQTLMREALMLGLRTTEGVNIPGAERRTNLGWATKQSARFERALSRGDVVLERESLYVPQHRWLYLDSITANLF